MQPLRTLTLVLAAAAGLVRAEEGFTPMFNGTDLTGWRGKEGYWSVQDGAIRGDTTKKPLGKNTFLIWDGGKPANFELKLSFRIQNGNGGVQYRSEELPDFAVKGYQAEVENAPGKVGFLYDEKAREWLVNVGDIMEITASGEKKVVGKVSNVEELKKTGYYHAKDWNEYHIICRGNHVLHYLNGHPTVELIDNDVKGRHLSGVIALQIHAGPGMVVDYKDLRIKELKGSYGDARRLFNGTDLAGWTVPFENVKAASTFTVKDGVLHDGGNPAGYIRTTDDFGSYVLRLQIRHLTEGNSGVLLRMAGGDKVWPKSIECQGQFRAKGDIWNIDNFPMKTDPARTDGRHTVKMHPDNEKPLGGWNDYEMVLKGGDLEIYVNRLLQNTATGCDATPGKICFQSEGSEVEFRNIVLIPVE
ncbi:MAG: DUF1080 domain-containing protein [Kiritimatiellia bacterium]